VSAVFGLPVYNGEQHLAEALESLLTQTRGDLAVIVVDNASTDATPQIAQRYAQLDLRVSHVRNERTVGLVHNWRRAFNLAGERHPDAPYFAWASDHDVWHPRWLELLGAELDEHPEAVLAYPAFVRIDDAGAEYPTREQRFETAGVQDARERLRRTARELAAAGELIYGLARREALARCGPFPAVVLPDRLHLLRLAVEGEFRHVPRRLWHRRYRGGVVVSNRRQRRAFAPDPVPLSARAPWWLAHPVALRRAFQRQRGLARVAFAESVRHAYDRRRERVARRRRWATRRVRRAFRNAPLIRLLPGRTSIQPPVKPELGPLDLALEALGGTELLDGLAADRAVLLELGASGLTEALEVRFPGLRSAREAGGDIDLLVSVSGFEKGVPPDLPPARYLYSLDREDEGLRRELERDYWLRELWVSRQGEPKPDPLRGPVPRVPGRLRHLLGRRRLLSAPR
jgi:glycosyltransferase involved in cell wall biosynthesis